VSHTTDFSGRVSVAAQNSISQAWGIYGGDNSNGTPPKPSNRNCLELLRKRCRKGCGSQRCDISQKGQRLRVVLLVKTESLSRLSVGCEKRFTQLPAERLHRSGFPAFLYFSIRPISSMGAFFSKVMVPNEPRHFAAPFELPHGNGRLADRLQGLLVQQVSYRTLSESDFSRDEVPIRNSGTEKRDK
jgi:hypothetical protein